MSFSGSEKVPTLSLSEEKMFDLIYSSYGYEVLVNHVHDTIKNETTLFLEGKMKKKSTLYFSEKHKLYHEIVAATKYIGHEFAFLTLFQGMEKKNRSNPYLAQKIVMEGAWENVLRHYVKHMAKINKVSLNEKQISSLVKKIKKEIDLKKNSLSLFKNHVPPLFQEKPKEKYYVDIQDTDYTPYFGDSPAKYLKWIPKKEINPLTEVIYYSVNEYPLSMSQFLEKETWDYMKKKYTEKKKFSEAVYRTVALYETMNITNLLPNYPDVIRDSELKQLFETSFNLFSSPFGMPKKKYFSLCPPLERHFGSLGYIWKAHPKEGLFSLRCPPSYIFVGEMIRKTLSWLKEAKKKKRKLEILFWYPRFTHFYSKNNNDNTILKITGILTLPHNELYPLLNKSPFKKKVFNFKHDGKVAPKSENYDFRVFLLKS